MDGLCEGRWTDIIRVPIPYETRSWRISRRVLSGGLAGYQASEFLRREIDADERHGKDNKMARLACLQSAQPVLLQPYTFYCPPSQNGSELFILSSSEVHTGDGRAALFGIAIVNQPRRVSPKGARRNLANGIVIDARQPMAGGERTWSECDDCI